MNKPQFGPLSVNCGRGLKSEYGGKALRGVSRLPLQNADLDAKLRLTGGGGGEYRWFDRLIDPRVEP